MTCERSDRRGYSRGGHAQNGAVSKGVTPITEFHGGCVAFSSGSGRQGGEMVRNGIARFCLVKTIRLHVLNNNSVSRFGWKRLVVVERVRDLHA